jgi:hypothetical protein
VRFTQAAAARRRSASADQVVYADDTNGIRVMAEVQWWYARDDEQLGPLSPTELRRLAAGGGLAPTDLVWREGLSEWAPAGRIKGLFPEMRDPADEAPLPPAGPPSGIRTGSPQASEGLFPTDASASGGFSGELPAIAQSGGTPIDSQLFRAAGLGDEQTPFPADEVPLPPPRRSHIPFVLFLVQGVLWGTCGLVVLLGGLVFSVSRLRGTSSAEEAASATVLGMFFIGAYVVAQAGEKISRLVLAFLERRRDG